MNYHFLLALALAALLPIALVATGVELRRVRLRIIDDLQTAVFKEDQELPQMMLARARYGRAVAPRHGTGEDQALHGAALPIAGRGRQDEVKQYFGALIYTLICTGGFALLFVPASILLGSSTYPLNIPDAVFWLPEPFATGENGDALRRTVAIAGVAFLGGYVFNMRYLIRQTLNQELSALAFVRAGLRLLQGVIVAVVVYHVGATALGAPAVPGPETTAAAGPVVTSVVATSSVGLAAGLAVAFMLGYFPDLGLGRVAQIARIHVKEVDQRAFEKARIIPLEIIDGIDHEVAFRLQESNLFDVQNLAVANPIEIYAETPYTLLQVFDWVLQAQLCLVAGVQAFDELKRHKIRTIFDLERAVLATGVPDSYLRALVAVLLSDASGPFRTAIGLAAKYDEGAPEGQVSIMNLRHIVAIVSDDLHVHRLRALWRAIMHATAGISDDGRPLWLFATDWLPGDPPPEPA